MKQDDNRQAMFDTEGNEHSVIVIIDGRVISLTREQEALIRSWASGPV